MCHFSITNNEQPLALDDFENLHINRLHEINLDRNFITAFTAAIVDSLFLVFTAILDRNGNSFIIGVSILYTIDHCTLYKCYIILQYVEGIE